MKGRGAEEQGSRGAETQRDGEVSSAALPSCSSLPGTATSALHAAFSRLGRIDRGLVFLEGHLVMDHLVDRVHIGSGARVHDVRASGLSDERYFSEVYFHEHFPDRILAASHTVNVVVHEAPWSPRDAVDRLQCGVDGPVP